jgi:hypothetical protein
MKGIGDGIWNTLIEKSNKTRSGWNGDCGIVDGMNDEWVEWSKQKVEWLSDRVKEINPKKILETGTNYGSWSWLLYNTLEGDWELNTADIVVDSRECIEEINRYYGGDKVHFHHSDSVEFLKGWSGSVDLVWVDSQHTEEFLYSELVELDRIGPEWIMIDDWSWRDLKPAIVRFVGEREGEWIFIKESPVDTQWSSVVILKKGEEWRAK